MDRVEDIGRGVARAIRTAVSGRPGGVYLDIPAAVLGQVIDAAAGEASLRRVVDPAPRQLPAPEAVDRAIALLADAQRPLVVLGKGAAYSQADKQIRAFIEATGLPFLPMSMAKGLLPDYHPQSVAAARSLALSRADVVMLVGARLNWLLGHGEAPQWNPDAKFIQVDIEPTELDSNQPIAAPLVGDIGSVMTALIERHASPGRSPRRRRGATSSPNARRRTSPRWSQRLDADPHPMRFYGALAGDPRRPARAPGRLCRQRRRQRPRLRAQRDRHARAASPPRQRHVGSDGHRDGLRDRRRRRERRSPSSPSKVTARSGSAVWSWRPSAATGCPSSSSCSTTAACTAATASTHSPTDPAPTTLMPQARHDRLIEAFGGKGYHATTPAEVTAALTDALASGGPGAHRLRDRPQRRHGKRPSNPPQPDRRREATDTKDRLPEGNPS